MDVLTPAQNLVDEKLYVFVAKLLVGFYDACKVGVHELTDYVYLSHVKLRFRELNCLHCQYIRIIKKTHYLELPQCALRVDRMVKGLLDFLDRYVVPCLGVQCRYHHAIRPRPNDLLDSIPLIKSKNGILEHRFFCVDLTRTASFRY
jgi:hypothetical protein